MPRLWGSGAWAVAVRYTPDVNETRLRHGGHLLFEGVAFGVAVLADQRHERDR